MARQANLKRFVFTSSYVTLGRRRGHVATEEDVLRWRRKDWGYCTRCRGYGPSSWCCSTRRITGCLPWRCACPPHTVVTGRTPQGAMMAGMAFGKVPFVMDGVRLEAVGVEDAARAMILAAERGRNGERYIVSES